MFYHIFTLRTRPTVYVCIYEQNFTLQQLEAGILLILKPEQSLKSELASVW